MLKSGANALLDEPTNDPTSTPCGRSKKRSRSRLCRIISHDRWFLDRIATTSSLEGDSHVNGSRQFQDYEADKMRRLERI
jgi:ATPase subunit of ABC transporter with duplicated ATPase domains